MSSNNHREKRAISTNYECRLITFQNNVLQVIKIILIISRGCIFSQTEPVLFQCLGKELYFHLHYFTTEKIQCRNFPLKNVLVAFAANGSSLMSGKKTGKKPVTILNAEENTIEDNVQNGRGFWKMYKYLFLILFIFGNIFVQDIIAQDIIDISVKGISDSNKEGAQKDRQEAIMDAKRQACEKAGVQLKSTTTVENFQTIFDYIESKSEAVLLPGFQIIDIGYVADETYQVVLSGKIKVVKEEKISAKELRYAKSLFDRQKFNECQKILEKYINSA